MLNAKTESSKNQKLLSVGMIVAGAAAIIGMTLSVNDQLPPAMGEATKASILHHHKLLTGEDAASVMQLESAQLQRAMDARDQEIHQACEAQMAGNRTAVTGGVLGALLCLAGCLSFFIKRSATSRPETIAPPAPVKVQDATSQVSMAI